MIAVLLEEAHGPVLGLAGQSEFEREGIRDKLACRQPVHVGERVERLGRALDGLMRKRLDVLVGEPEVLVFLRVAIVDPLCVGRGKRAQSASRTSRTGRDWARARIETRTKVPAGQLKSDGPLHGAGEGLLPLVLSRLDSLAGDALRVGLELLVFSHLLIASSRVYAWVSPGLQRRSECAGGSERA